MQKRQRRSRSNWAHDDAWFFARCVEYIATGAQPREFTDEVYSVIQAVLKQLNVSQCNGFELFRDMMQECCVRIFGYSMPRMVATAGENINAHSYIYQSAYYTVLQFFRKKRRRARVHMDEQVLSEVLGQLVYDDTGVPTVTKDGI